MKRRITLSFVLTLSVLMSLVSLPSTAQGQQPQSFSASSGLVTLGEGQTLRVTAAACAIGCVEELMEFFSRLYSAGNCSGSPQVCQHTVVSQGVSARHILGPNGALSFDVQGPGAVNVTVRSNSRNARLTAMILDTATGKVNVVWDILEE